MEPNAPLLLKTLEHIENHPEEWEQQEWGCGTTGCFAFHAALIDGGKVLVDHYFLAEESDAPDVLIGFTAGDVISVRYRAQRILGITHEQAERLFAGSNNLDDLSAEVYRLAGDWDRLAELTERVLINAINGQDCTPSAFIAPGLDFFDGHQLWEDAQEAIRELQMAEDSSAVLDSEVTGPDFDPETYVNHLRGLVKDAVHKLIGRPA